MKLVIDTNIVVSATFWHGNPYRILTAWTFHQFELFVSRPILDEYTESVDRIFKRYPNKPSVDWLAEIKASAGFITAPKGAAKSRDPDDDIFLDCATAAGADYLVTGDEDLLVLKTVGRLQILTPAEMVRIIS